MNRPRLRVADVFRQYAAEYTRTHNLPGRLLKVIKHITQCRTAALGGHLYRCDRCNSEVPLYNSCRDRHCPTCQTLTKEKWLEARRAELLPVRYFHAVFTLPHLLNPLIRCNRHLLLRDLFGAVNQTLQLFAADPQWRLKGKLGFIAVLHTWNQLLFQHVHVHCIIPGGVWRENERRWVHSRKKYLFKKDSLALCFRRLFIERLEALRKQGKLQYKGKAADLSDPQAWTAFIGALRAKKWIVYPKRAFGGAQQVFDYLGRYTHRVAISDHRIRRMQHGSVTFSYRNRKKDNLIEEETLPAAEFIRRFLLHILPPGFHKIRFFGWMAHNAKAGYLEKIRASLGVEPPPPRKEETPEERILRLTGIDTTRCPCCRKGTIHRIGRIHPRAPP